jgi:TolA-binding protein
MTECPDELELAKAISTDDPQVAAHVAQCASCRSEWGDTMRVIAIARQQTAPMPSREHFEELRTALLAMPRSEAVPPTKAGRSRRIVWIPASVLAAAAVFALVMFSRSDTPDAPTRHRHGSITAHAGASHAAAAATPDEIVILYDGSIDVDVAPLHAGERFRVLLADAEIEVHGTAFVATARAGHLLGVTVRHGVVEVRPTGAPSRRLAAGESWAAAPEVAGAPVAPPGPAPAAVVPVDASAPVVEPIATRPPIRSAVTASRSEPRHPHRQAEPQAEPAAEPQAEPAAEPSPPARKAGEVAYDDAWTAMREGAFARAAAAFSRVSILDADGALAEDASFWLAVALERGKESARAATAFREFIAAFPAARRVGEANAMLGWILVDSNQPDEAARRFRAALDDPSPAVRDSAKAGLDAVGNKM